MNKYNTNLQYWTSVEFVDNPGRRYYYRMPNEFLGMLEKLGFDKGPLLGLVACQQTNQKPPVKFVPVLFYDIYPADDLPSDSKFTFDKLKCIQEVCPHISRKLQLRYERGILYGTSN